MDQEQVTSKDKGTLRSYLRSKLLKWSSGRVVNVNYYLSRCCISEEDSICLLSNKVIIDQKIFRYRSWHFDLFIIVGNPPQNILLKIKKMFLDARTVHPFMIGWVDCCDHYKYNNKNMHSVESLLPAPIIVSSDTRNIDDAINNVLEKAIRLGLYVQ